jgi:hypothetical protein
MPMLSVVLVVKVKSIQFHLEHMEVLISFSMALSRQWTNPKVLDTRPVYRRTCRLLPSLRWYQIILLGDRGTCATVRISSTGILFQSLKSLLLTN